MHIVEQQLSDFIQQYPQNSRLLVAFSGGCDSIVLLHALHTLFPDRKPLAIHINHGLQAQSNDWARFCADYAHHKDIQFHLVEVQLDPKAANIEERARIVRYQAFAAHMQANDLLLTAHHQDDQAETFLLQLLRGAGLDGLGGIKPINDFPPGKLARPLLGLSRDQLEDYARLNELKWVEDPSNADTRFDRNFLRQQILPQLQSRWPGAPRTIARAAQNCREAAELVDSFAQQDLHYCLGAYQHSLSIEKLKQLSVARQHALVRSWVKHNDLPMPDRQMVETICDELVNCREDSEPVLKWSYVNLHRFKGFLYLIADDLHEKQEKIICELTPWDLSTGKLELPFPVGRLLFEAAGEKQTVQLGISFREPGQSVKLVNASDHHKKLKKLFQTWSVPPWMRDHVPLLFINNEMIAIADYAKCSTSFQSNIDVIKWQLPEALDWRNNL